MVRWLILAGIGCIAACASGDIGDPSVGADASMSPGPDSGDIDAPAPTPDAAIPDAAPPADAMPCDDGDLNAFDPVTGHCYMYFASEVPWTVALGACAALPGDTHLATITSADENAIVAQLDAGQQDSWLGGEDRMTEMTWLWITGEPMTYTFWRDGEPNNGGGEFEEDCMIIEIDTLDEWDDRPCDRNYSYICERDY